MIVFTRLITEGITYDKPYLTELCSTWQYPPVIHHGNGEILLADGKSSRNGNYCGMFLIGWINALYLDEKLQALVAWNWHLMA